MASELDLDHRKRLRINILRRRIIQRWIMVTLILLPVILAIIYLMFISISRYGAESRFLVRSSYYQSQRQTSPDNISDLISTSGSASSGSVDGWAVNSFLNSRDAMHQLDRKIGLRGYLTKSTLDPVNRLLPDASDDALYKAYKSMLSVSYNMQEQINLIKVSAFSPGDARLITLALLEIAQRYVDTMDEKGIADALRVSQEAVTLAEKQARQAQENLANWRLKNGNIDPEADMSMQRSLISQLESQLNDAFINFYKVRALDNPTHPLIPVMKIEISALQKRLTEARQRLNSMGDTDIIQFHTYQELKNSQLFADANLETARLSYHQAFIGTLRLQRYLSIIEHPEPSDRPVDPNIFLLLIEALAMGFLLAFLYRISIGVYHTLRLG